MLLYETINVAFLYYQWAYTMDSDGHPLQPPPQHPHPHPHHQPPSRVHIDILNYNTTLVCLEHSVGYGPF